MIWTLIKNTIISVIITNLDYNEKYSHNGYNNNDNKLDYNNEK